MSNYITPPYPIFTDVTGTPLDAGFVFIGAEDSDAIANPINVYWDKEKTQLADQPLKTRNGYISKDGSPCKIFIDQPSCSIFVKNRFNTTVLNDLSFDILSNSSAVVAAVGAEQERATSAETVLDQKIDTTNTTLDSKITNESSRAQAIEEDLQNQVNAVGVGNKAYKTYAEMDADKANIPVKSKVTVTNDATASNNGDWQWDGVAFTKSDYDPIAQSQNYTDEKTNFWQARDVQVQQFDAFSKFSVGFVGENGKVPLGIKKDGTVVSEKLESSDVQAEVLNANQVVTETQTVAGMQMQALDPFSGYVFGIGNGTKYPLAFRNDGVIEIDKLKVNKIELSTEETKSEKFEKASQEWWIYPAHTYTEKPFPRVISGIYSESGEIIVGEYVIGQGITKRFKVGQTAIVDDHNAPSIWVKEGHRSVVVWQEHDQTNHLFAKVSTKDGDISTFEYATEQQIAAGQPISYTQLHHSEIESTETADIFYIFSRFNQQSWGFTKISVNQVTGIITTLDQQNILTASEQYYMTSTLADGKFRLASTSNASLSTNTIHYWEIDIATGEMTDHAGNVVGNIISHASLPVEIATVTPLLAQKANYRRRLFYVRPLPMSPAIAFAEWLTANAANTGIYKVIALENGAWVERNYANVGKAFNTTYFSGMSFPDPCVKDEVIVCRYDNATNQGVLERVINVDETMITIETERVDKDFLIRPISPIGGGSLCAVAQLYSYGATGTFSFESDVKFKFLK